MAFERDVEERTAGRDCEILLSSSKDIVSEFNYNQHKALRRHRSDGHAYAKHTKRALNDSSVKIDEQQLLTRSLGQSVMRSTAQVSLRVDRLCHNIGGPDDRGTNVGELNASKLQRGRAGSLGSLPTNGTSSSFTAKFSKSLNHMKRTLDPLPNRHSVTQLTITSNSQATVGADHRASRYS